MITFDVIFLHFKLSAGACTAENFHFFSLISGNKRKYTENGVLVWSNGFLESEDYDFNDDELLNISREIELKHKYEIQLDENLSQWDPDNAEPSPAVRNLYQNHHVDINKYIPLTNPEKYIRASSPPASPPPTQAYDGDMLLDLSDFDMDIVENVANDEDTYDLVGIDLPEAETQLLPQPPAQLPPEPPVQKSDEELIAQMSSEHKAYSKSQLKQSSVRGADGQAKAFAKFLLKKDENRNMLELSPALLDQYISSYLLDLKVTKKVDGKKVVQNPQTSTLSTYYANLSKYFELKEYPHDLKKKPECGGLFPMSHKIFTARKKQLTKEGFGGLPNARRMLEMEEEELLWTSGAFGDHNPESLLHALFWLISMQLGFRASHEACQLKVGDFEEVSNS